MSFQKNTKEEHHKRINIVLNYIANHLDEKLDLNRLSSISLISPYHFHRIMKAHLQEPLGSYIIRIRIETGAQLLRHTSLPINEIANKMSYNCSTSFAKAFKKQFDISPTEFRNNKEYYMMKTQNNNKVLPQGFILKPKIIERKNKTAIYIQLIGEYQSNDYNGAWGKLWGFIKKKRLFSFNQENLGIAYDDPNVTEGNKCRYDCCVTIKKETSAEGEIGVKEIAGGKYAVFKFKGEINYIGAVYDVIFNTWFPGSEYELRNVPAYEKYIKFSKTNPTKNKTEIYIPIK